MMYFLECIFIKGYMIVGYFVYVKLFFLLIREENFGIEVNFSVYTCIYVYVWNVFYKG